MGGRITLASKHQDHMPGECELDGPPQGLAAYVSFPPMHHAVSVAAGARSSPRAFKTAGPVLGSGAARIREGCRVLPQHRRPGRLGRCEEGAVREEE